MINLTTLNSGFRIATDTMTDVKTVTVLLAISVGSRFEDEPKQCGIAHFLEHMAFKGTENRTALDIAKQIEEVGGHMNAFTSKEMTAYYAVVLKENLELAIDIIADILQNSTFDKDEIEKERGVILEELANSEDTPDDIVFDYYYETLYQNQPLGRPIIGNKETIAAFQTKDFQNFINSKYNAGNMVLSVAGNLNHDEVVKLANQYFTKLNKSKEVKCQPSSYTGGECVNPNKELTQIKFLLGFKGFEFNNNNKYALKIANNILGGGMSSRLFQEVREKQGLCYTVSSFESSFTDSGIFGIYAGTSPEKLTELEKVVNDELQKITQDIKEDEIKKTITQIKAGLVMSLESTSGRAQKLASNILSYNRAIPHDEIMNNFTSVTVKQIQDTMAEVLSSKITRVIYGNVL
jgi:predicted Zn-dependent peptidase